MTFKKNKRADSAKFMKSKVADIIVKDFRVSMGSKEDNTSPLYSRNSKIS